MKKQFNNYLGLSIFMGFTIIVVILTYIVLSEKPKEEIKEQPELWIPTEEDIKYQDSMYNIIHQTQLEVDTIKDQMDGIIYKLERLYYEDGTYDSIRVPIDNENVEMDCGDTLTVKATMYHPVEAQCDSDPLVTADGSIIDPYKVSDWNWIAVSRDLLVSGGGCLNYGDSVYVVAGHKTGWYIVHDTMHKRKRNQIDFLESIGTHVYRYKEAELVINS
jgi:3D (Asp-Asp-Asp) domain-containing protein